MSTEKNTYTFDSDSLFYFTMLVFLSGMLMDGAISADELLGKVLLAVTSAIFFVFATWPIIKSKKVSA
nr:hypothetical protein [uncultured Methanolobus sp.]